MYGLDLRKMLNNTSSEKIHVWKPGKKGIVSNATDDPKKAEEEYINNKASLYFGANI